MEKMQVSDEDCSKTDSKEYIEVFKECGIPQCDLLLRPKSLGEDNVVDYPVALDALTKMEEQDKVKYENIYKQRPTSPMRESNLIERSLEILSESRDCSSVRAVRLCKEHPYRLWKIGDVNGNGYMVNAIGHDNEVANIPRQYLPTNYYYQSGEIEVVRRKTLLMGSMSGKI